MATKPDKETQIKKLRRRIEDFLRKCDVQILVKVAELIGIRVPRELKKELKKELKEDDVSKRQ